MISVARFVRRRRPAQSSKKSPVRQAATMMVESLELRRLFAYTLASTIDSPSWPIDLPLHPTAGAEENANFGSSIASKGNLVLIGAPRSAEDPVPGSRSAAYLFDVSNPANPTLLHKFSDPDQQGSDMFGAAVAIFDDGRLAISAPEDHTGGVGKVFIYDDVNDATPAVLVGDSSVSGFHGFGGAIAQVGNSVFVIEIDPPDVDGNLYAVRRYDNVVAGVDGNVLMSPTSYSIPRNPSISPALAVQDGKLLVSGHDGSVGRIYQIDPSNDSVTPLFSDSANDFAYGASIAVSGDSVFVGSPGVNTVYEYADTDNTADRTFIAPAGSGSARTQFGFGLGLTVNGDKLLVGNSDADPGDEDGLIEGEAYVYDLTSIDTTVPLATLQSPTVDPGDDFSFAAAALPNGGFVIGDPLDDGGANDTGAAYVFVNQLPPPPPPTNQPPTANIGGPYFVNENATITLDASGSSDPDVGDTLAYAWDLDNDGQFDDATGATVNFSRDLPAGYTVHVQVTDGALATDTDTAVVTVNDVAPTANAGADQSAVLYQTVNVSGSGASTSDTIASYAWDLDNDGDFDDATGATAAVAFSSTGAKTVRLQATDDDGQTAIDTLIVNVSATPLVVGDTIFVGGTAGSDSVAIKKGTTGSTITVNGQNTNFSGTRIVVYGGPGADTITVSASANVSLEAYGGGGNDSISGGGGNDILVGGDNNDILYGGSGRDVLIGGDGADGVFGEVNDDILIAANTAYDTDSAGLNAIMAIWNGPLSFDDRVNQLRTGLLTPNQEVWGDGDVDTLTGKSGDDWFLFLTGEDIATDIKSADATDQLTFLPPE